jgi:hypothetical protein
VLKIVDNLMPAVIKAVEFAAMILKPFLDAIKLILDGLAAITSPGNAFAMPGASGKTVSQTRADTAARFRTGLDKNGQPVPMSPAASVLTSSTTTQSNVAITVGNLPPGSSVKQDKPAPGVTLATGQTVKKP